MTSPAMNIHYHSANAVPNEACRTFVYRHVVSFEETNVVGNVYFARHISWQGRCREMFLRQHAPAILEELAGDLRLITLRVSCEYFEELSAFDEVDVHMMLAHMRQHRIGLEFEYRRPNKHGSRIAQGFQEIGCMRWTRNGLVQTAPPPTLAEALRAFTRQGFG